MLTAFIVAIAATSITIEYRFTNTAASDVYIFSTLFHTDLRGDRTPDPELVYVVPGAPGEAVVGKYLVAIPAGMKVEAPEIPYLRLVHPGESHVGRAIVPVPLRLYTPYFDPRTPDPGESGVVTRLRLRLGVLEATKFPSPAPVVEPVPPPPPDSFICDYGFGVAIQRFFEAELRLPDPGVPEHFFR
jgi:hypothetical protein